MKGSHIKPSASRENVVWLGASATTFSCLCEPCLDAAEAAGASFLAAVRDASVRGTVAVEADVVFAHCAGGHQIILRRVERPPKLARADERQLQIA
jgi:hypothetical protein